MGNKSNFNSIRGIIVQQKDQTIIMQNQIDRYKEALKKAQGISKESGVNVIKVDSTVIKEQFTQESSVKPTLNNLDNNRQNPQTQTKPSNENKHNTESFIESVRRKFSNFFRPTN